MQCGELSNNNDIKENSEKAIGLDKQNSNFG